MLMMLEPRREEKNVIIADENQEWLEIFFFFKGDYAIGFELNKRKHFPVVIPSHNTQVIGLYGVTFNKRANFCYKTLQTCEGYTIKQQHWLKLMEDNAVITNEFVNKTNDDYIENIMNKINRIKITETEWEVAE